MIFFPVTHKIGKLIGNYLKRILVDNSLSKHLNHHECNNIGTFKRGRCLFVMSDPKRCTDLFVVMSKLEGGWSGLGHFWVWYQNIIGYLCWWP